MTDRLQNNLATYMDLLSTRQKLVSANIANAGTPGYKTKDFDFQFEYMSALGDGPGASPSPNVHETPDLKSRNDGNNVNLDRESRLLAENALRFQVASQLLRSQNRMIRNAIQESKNG
jgi:flagellar basal-body rod protein FlgB